MERTLYVGTTEAEGRRAPRIGLSPACSAGDAPGALRLTSCYPITDALQLLAESGRQDPVIAVVAVDLAQLDPACLLPDERFLDHRYRAHIWRGALPPLPERLMWFRERLAEFQWAALMSLRDMGYVRYRGSIPPAAVSRVALVEWRRIPILTLLAQSAVSSLSGYARSGRLHRRLTEWVMGEPVSPAEIAHIRRWSESPKAVLWQGALQWLLSNRSGITILPGGSDGALQNGERDVQAPVYL